MYTYALYLHAHIDAGVCVYMQNTCTCVSYAEYLYACIDA